MTTKTILSTLLFSALLPVFIFAEDGPGKSYSIRGISFFENGFPKSMKFRLYGHSLEEYLPCQIVVSAESDRGSGKEEIIVKEFIEGVEVDKRNERVDGMEQEAIEITLDFKSCMEMRFAESPEKWKLTKISGPRMELSKGAAFVPIIISESHLIGFAVAPTNNDKILQKWKDQKIAEK